MNEAFNKWVLESTPNQEKANELLEKLFTVAQPGAVYQEPVVSGDYTVITASELTAALGAGYGGGGGFGPEGEEAAESSATTAAGMGGGGGGKITARPVAVISIGPDGVDVEPVVDATKIGIAFFTTIGAMFMFLGKMRRFLHRGKVD
jgi:uncharacterized spore protein YtfJ